MTDAVLATRGLCKSFGGVHVTTNVDFSLPAGARHALIGPNGAGKSTLINLLTGALAPTSGTISMNGAEITSYTTERRVRLGLVRTFQVNTLFPNLTPLEATALAVSQRTGKSASIFRKLSSCTDEIDEAYELLEKLDLATFYHRPTRELPYGRQRLVEIALALALRPKVLLLDEPAAGIPAKESEKLFGIISALPSDIAILFIEHDMDLVFRFAQRITVLVAGGILCEGTPSAIAAHPVVRSVYLGLHKGG